jgi:hypothetical protein
MEKKGARYGQVLAVAGFDVTRHHDAGEGEE